MDHERIKQLLEDIQTFRAWNDHANVRECLESLKNMTGDHDKTPTQEDISQQQLTEFYEKEE